MSTNYSGKREIEEKECLNSSISSSRDRTAQEEVPKPNELCSFQGMYYFIENSRESGISDEELSMIEKTYDSQSDDCDDDQRITEILLSNFEGQYTNEKELIQKLAREIERLAKKAKCLYEKNLISASIKSNYDRLCFEGEEQFNSLRKEIEVMKEQHLPIEEERNALRDNLDVVYKELIKKENTIESLEKELEFTRIEIHNIKLNYEQLKNFHESGEREDRQTYDGSAKQVCKKDLNQFSTDLCGVNKSEFMENVSRTREILKELLEKGFQNEEHLKVISTRFMSRSRTLNLPLTFIESMSAEYERILERQFDSMKKINTLKTMVEKLANVINDLDTQGESNICESLRSELEVRYTNEKKLKQTIAVLEEELKSVTGNLPTRCSQGATRKQVSLPDDCLDELEFLRNENDKLRFQLLKSSDSNYIDSLKFEVNNLKNKEKDNDVTIYRLMEENKQLRSDLKMEHTPFDSRNRCLNLEEQNKELQKQIDVLQQEQTKDSMEITGLKLQLKVNFLNFDYQTFNKKRFFNFKRIK